MTKVLKYFLSGICIVFASISFAQDNKVVLIDADPIDPKRYEDVMYSPYLFEEFVPATLIDKDRNELTYSKINYNGYTQEFEYQTEDKVIELDKSYHLVVKFNSDKFTSGLEKKMSKSTQFIRGINPTDFDEFYIEVYKGESHYVFKEFEVTIVNNKIQNVGQTIDRKMFAAKFVYFIAKDGNLTPFSLNKKSVTQALGSTKAVKSYIKSNKLRMNEESDLTQLFEELKF
ncbi:MAG: hypothetical protein JXQ90_02015 [Cyclobacteriaceae bacterium]